MTYIEFLASARFTLNNLHPAVRKGQALYNLLSVQRPDIGRQIVGTNADPFYDDGHINMFYERVAELW
jgi:hypothetical protein